MLALVLAMLMPFPANWICSKAGCFERRDYFTFRFYDDARRHDRHQLYRFGDPGERKCFIIEGVTVCREQGDNK